MAKKDKSEATVSPQDKGPAANPDDEPVAGGTLNFDDDDMAHPRGNVTGQGGTWEAQGGDSGKLGRPAEILSDRIGPSDPDKSRK
ncbi:MAG: serine/threonine protein kinase [Ramlibacter sp.]|nr:serine/threonine protein kinase [Ramlibacter sp.]